ncbi:MAG: hypothetical protein KKH77_07625, partial [Candidatus Omnitrophica bacterium]|nr:hypothetical protein [Candidatus Omnitrophota bacterium]MBU1808827.1 hypothetical protein [Candidatus Omnitrophota bacterium]
RPDIPKEALMLPPVDLDALLDKKLVDQAIGGYDVYSAPYMPARLQRKYTSALPHLEVFIRGDELFSPES